MLKAALFGRILPTALLRKNKAELILLVSEPINIGLGSLFGYVAKLIGNNYIIYCYDVVHNCMRDTAKCLKEPTHRTYVDIALYRPTCVMLAEILPFSTKNIDGPYFEMRLITKAPSLSIRHASRQRLTQIEHSRILINI